MIITCNDGYLDRINFDQESSQCIRDPLERTTLRLQNSNSQRRIGNEGVLPSDGYHTDSNGDTHWSEPTSQSIPVPSHNEESSESAIRKRDQEMDTYIQSLCNRMSISRESCASLFEYLLSGDVLNDDIDRIIKEILQIPLTPQSIELRGPDGLPLGIEVAVNKSRRGEYSTSLSPKEYFPLPLRPRPLMSTPTTLTEPSELTPTVASLEDVQDLESSRDPDESRHNIEQTSSAGPSDSEVMAVSMSDSQSSRYSFYSMECHNNAEKLVSSERSTPEPTIRPVKDLHTSRHSIGSIESGDEFGCFLPEESYRPEQLLAFAYQNVQPSCLQTVADEAFVKSSIRNKSPLSLIKLQSWQPMPETSDSSPQDEPRDLSKYETKPLPPIPQPKEAVGVKKNNLESQSVTDPVLDRTTTRVLKKKQHRSAFLLETGDRGQPSDFERTQASISLSNNTPTPLSPSFLSSENQSLASKPSIKPKISPSRSNSQLLSSYLHYSPHYPPTHSSDPTPCSLSGRDSPLSLSYRSHARYNTRSRHRLLPGVTREYHKATEDLNGLRRIRSTDFPRRQPMTLGSDRTDILEESVNEPSDFSSISLEKEFMLGGVTSYPMKSKTSVLKRLSECHLEEREDRQSPGENNDEHQKGPSILQMIASASAASVPHEGGNRLEETTVHPGRLVTGDTTVASSISSTGSDSTEIALSEQRKERQMAAERQRQILKKKGSFEAKEAGSGLRRGKQCFEKVCFCFLSPSFTKTTASTILMFFLLTHTGCRQGKGECCWIVQSRGKAWIGLGFRMGFSGYEGSLSVGKGGVSVGLWYNRVRTITVTSCSVGRTGSLKGRNSFVFSVRMEFFRGRARRNF